MNLPENVRDLLKRRMRCNIALSSRRGRRCCHIAHRCTKKLSGLNTLVLSGSQLQLTDAEGINDRGEIAGTACVVSNGVCTSEVPAFLAVPCDEEHADTEGCDDRVQGAISVERPKVTFPQNVREMMRQRQGLRGLMLGR